MTSAWLDLLGESLPALHRRAGRHDLTALAERLEAAAGGPPPDNPCRALAWVLSDCTRRYLAADQECRALLSNLAGTTGDRRVAVAEALAHLGSPQDLASEPDPAAVADRCARHLHRLRLPWELLASAVTRQPAGWYGGDEAEALVRSALPLLDDAAHPWTLRAAAARVLGVVAARPDQRDLRPVLATVAATDTDDPWVQVTALEAWTGAEEDPAAVDDLLARVLRPPAQGTRPQDHAFVRARAVHLAGIRARWDLVRGVLAVRDPSDHVRIAAVRALASAPGASERAVLRTLVRGRDADPSPVVRAAATLACLPGSPSLREREPGAWWEIVAEALHPQQDPRVVAPVARGVLLACADGSVRAEDAEILAEAWEDHLLLWAAAAAPEVARLAALLRLRLRNWLERRGAQEVVDAWMSGASPGSVLRVRTGPVALLGPDALLDVLAVTAATLGPASALPHPPDAPLTGPAAAPDGWEIHRDTPGRPPAGCLVAPEDPEDVAFPTPALLATATRHGHVRVRDVRATWDLRSAPGASGSLVLLGDWLARRRHTLATRGDEGARDGWSRLLRRVGFRLVPPGGEDGAALAVVGLDTLLARLDFLKAPTTAQLLLLAAGGGGWWVVRTILQARRHRRRRSRVPLVLVDPAPRATTPLLAALAHGLGLSTLAFRGRHFVEGIPGRDPVVLPTWHTPGCAEERRRLLRLAADLEVQVVAGPSWDDGDGAPDPLDPDVVLPRREPPVRALEAALLPPDLLALLPAGETPEDVARVLHAARDLGIPMDMALRALADCAVTFPAAGSPAPPPHLGFRHRAAMDALYADLVAGRMGRSTAARRAREMVEAGRP